MTLAQLDAEHPVDHDILVKLWQDEQDTCHKCGRQRSICSDPEVEWYPQRTVCYADMARAWVQWQWDRLHGPDSQQKFHNGSLTAWASHRSDGMPYAADDGVSLWVSTENLSPDDNFLDERGGESRGSEA